MHFLLPGKSLLSLPGWRLPPRSQARPSFTEESSLIPQGSVMYLFAFSYLLASKLLPHCFHCLLTSMGFSLASKLSCQQPYLFSAQLNPVAYPRVLHRDTQQLLSEWLSKTSLTIWWSKYVCGKSYSITNLLGACLICGYKQYIVFLPLFIMFVIMVEMLLCSFD